MILKYTHAKMVTCKDKRYKKNKAKNWRTDIILPLAWKWHTYN